MSWESQTQDWIESADRAIKEMALIIDSNFEIHRTRHRQIADHIRKLLEIVKKQEERINKLEEELDNDKQSFT